MQGTRGKHVETCEMGEKLTAEQQKKFVFQKLFLNQDGWIEEQRLHL